GGGRPRGWGAVDSEGGGIRQRMEKPATFLGMVFSPDGKNVYVSGGNGDVISAYAWRDARLEDEKTISLKEKEEARYPAGIAISPDGRFLYVAENVADDLAVIDLESQRVVQRLPTEHYPY